MRLNEDFEDLLFHLNAVRHYGRAKVRFLGMEDLITAKRTAGRRRDRADLDALRQKKKMIG